MKITVGDKLIVHNVGGLEETVQVGDEVEVTKVENFHTGKKGRPRKLFTCVKEDRVFQVTSDKVAKVK